MIELYSITGGLIKQANRQQATGNRKQISIKHSGFGKRGLYSYN